jgi:hypothetical protein
MATPQNMKRERSKGFKPVKSFNRCAQFKPFKGLTTVQSSDAPVKAGKVL